MGIDNQGKKRNIKKVVYLILIDLLIIFASFLIFIWIKPASIRVYLPRFSEPFLIFSGIWLLVSLIISKYNLYKVSRFKDTYVPVIIANLTIISVITTLTYSFEVFKYSRLIIFGTILLTTLMELLFSYLYYQYKHSIVIKDIDEIPEAKPRLYPVDKTFVVEKRDELKYIETREQIKNIIIEDSGKEVYEFISKHIDVGDPPNLVLSTTTQFNIEQLPSGRFTNLINLHRINDVRRINKFFECINEKIPYGGIYIGSSETFMLRKNEIMKKYPPVINHIYYFFDFIFTRVFPKTAVLKTIYFYITRGSNRVISKAETLGRLYSCGFECIEEGYINNKLYFVVKKIKEPLFDNNPSYGLFYKMPRIGKNGKIIYVYKLRTMHPYSEYLQKFMISKNGYDMEGKGKIKNDFRRTTYGVYFRKLWLDELPQLINVLKGEMRLVGVRPLSKTRFNEFPEEMKKRRILNKPGCIPPYVALLMPDEEGNIKAEEIYLNEKEIHPIWTDIKFFWMAVFNIITNRIRSA